MNFDAVKKAIEAMMDGDSAPFIALCSKDIYWESIHKSSVGGKVKNHAEVVLMLGGLKWAHDPQVTCLIDTAEVIAFTHLHESDPTTTYLCNAHIQNGKIAKYFYAKVVNAN